MKMTFSNHASSRKKLCCNQYGVELGTWIPITLFEKMKFFLPIILLTQNSNHVFQGNEFNYVLWRIWIFDFFLFCMHVDSICLSILYLNCFCGFNFSHHHIEFFSISHAHIELMFKFLIEWFFFNSLRSYWILGVVFNWIS